MLKELKGFVFFSSFIAILFILTLSSCVAVEDNLAKNNTQIEVLLAEAQHKLGSPYVYAKHGPDTFDCSGFVYYLFKQQNISLPRTSLAQSQFGNKISRQALQRGDILFFDTSGKGHINHSGIYLGDHSFIHASSGKAHGVTISDLDGWYKDKFKWGIRKN